MRSTVAKDAGSCLVTIGTRSRPTLRLVCFGHAGSGTAALRPLAARLPDAIETLAVRLPGREGRPHAVAAPARLVSELADAIDAGVDRPFALLGQSIGAWLAFAVAHELRARDRPPAHLFVLASAPPHLADPRAPLHELPGTELVAELERRYGGLPEAVLRSDDVLAHFLPILRADLRLAHSLEFVHEPALASPISALGGCDDRSLTIDALAAWKDETDAEFSLRITSGGHFLAQASPASVAGAVTEDLDRWRPA
ncbi:alpha/beta fold hydrolase [Solirubrobacter taibaiensis]|nr:alpha/beta fold hydrolase [Solirubrobacter taibaiensis]